MIIHRILNNNSIIALDEQGEEIVLLGNGLGFKKKSGDAVEEQNIEKRFTLTNKVHQDRFQELVESISQEYILIAEQIIQLAESQYEMKLNEMIHISLAEHIHKSVQDNRGGIIIRNSLLLDIIRYYPDEYEAAQRGLDMLETELGVRLEDDEAGFIAMHFVTAQYGRENGNTGKLIAMVKEVNEIILSELKIIPDEKSLSYYRYMTHLKFFAQRVMQNSHYPDDDDDAGMQELMILRYPKEYMCSKKVCRHIKRTYGYAACRNEMIYLTVHIARLTNKKK